MSDNKENSQQSRQYEVALACFTAAYELQAQQRRVNSNSLLEHLGKGSLSTTAKYARIWHGLQSGKDLEIPKDVRQAYETAIEGAGSTVSSPTDPAPPQYVEFVERLAHLWVQQLMQEGWLVTQRLTDQAIEAICLDADQRISGAEDGQNEAEKASAMAISKQQEQHDQLEALRDKNVQLQQKLDRLQGRLVELDSQRQEWTDKNTALEQTTRKQLVKLTEVEAQWKGAQHQVKALTEKVDMLETLLHKQSENIAKLTGEARAAEAQVTQLEKFIAKQQCADMAATQS